MADLGISKRRKRAEALSVEPGRLERQQPKQSDVTRSDIESLRSQLHSLEGQIQAIQSESPVSQEDQLANLESMADIQKQAMEVLENLYSEVNGKIDILIRQIEDNSIENYDVGDFPI